MAESFSETGFLDALFPMLQSSEDILLPPGDDCAVINAGSKKLALTVDQVIEGRHYLKEDGPFAAGRKLMARNLSDLAAVGAEPLFALSSSASSSDKGQEWLLDFHRGILAEAEKYNVLLIGGDLASTLSETVNSLTLIGEIKGNTAARAGAVPGDLLYVTGEFGRSFETKHHLTFTPKVEEGIWLSQLCSAMIDVTDGLLIDALRVSRASGLGLIINPETIPARDDAVIKHKLTDGEDYELLFAVSPENEEKLINNWPFSSPLTNIGCFCSDVQSGIALDPSGEDLSLLYGTGFDHFSES